MRFRRDRGSSPLQVGRAMVVKYLTTVSAAAIAVVLSSAGTFAETATNTTPAATASLPAITVSPVMKALLRDRVLANGLIGPVERVFVQPQIEGQQIEAILAEVGDSVTAGQVMARLSATALDLQKSQYAASKAAAEAAIAQAEAQLADAQASANQAEKVRKRAEALKAQGTTSQAAADQAISAATSATARVSVAVQGLTSAHAQLDLVIAQTGDVDLRLARTEIKAQVAGKIMQRNAQLGAIASAAGQPMFVLMRDGLLELQADVAEQDVQRLAVGQKVRLSVIGVTGDLSGTVRLVEPEVDVTTRLGRVRITLDDAQAVRSGQFAEAEILVSDGEFLAVPVTAVATQGGKQSVLRVSAEGLVDRVEVTTGIRDGGLVAVTAGLAEGDHIVARAGAFVRPGDHIHPVLADAPATGMSN